MSHLLLVLGVDQGQLLSENKMSLEPRKDASPEPRSGTGEKVLAGQTQLAPLNETEP